MTSSIAKSNGFDFSVKLSRQSFCKLNAMGRISAKKKTEICFKMGRGENEKVKKEKETEKEREFKDQI